MSNHVCCWHHYEDIRQENMQLCGDIGYCCRRECKNVKLLFGYDWEEKSHGPLLNFVPTAFLRHRVGETRACGDCGISEERAPFGPGGKDGAKLFVRSSEPKLVCYPCLEKRWRT